MNTKKYFHNGFLEPIFNNETPRKNFAVFDQEFGFYSEDYFHNMLVIERKRSERSQKSILLVMLGIGEVASRTSHKIFAQEIALLLTASTRDIDIKGWYKSGQHIGIIYTEISGSSKQTILEKIYKNLIVAFGPERGSKIAVSCALFPDENASSPGGPGNIADLRFYPVLDDFRPAKRLTLLFKRCADIIGSIFLILLFSPLFIIIAVLVKCSSNGPVLFTQTRIGLRGNKFTFYKFRSMRVGCDCAVHRDFVKNLIQGKTEGAAAQQPGVYKIVNDPRVTRIGKFLRKTSLDEIPQLFNVLFGDMSLVGPRPPIPYEIENYLSWHKRRVLEIKPGITGFWQVKGRSATSFDTMVRMDLQYITRWSLWWDFKLMLSTPAAIFKGAY
ncbi:MAG TPA: sugar transferase [Chitinivibrionales bacterium]|nr:sugar transferase [Chitinivibrionales bacterium]